MRSCLVPQGVSISTHMAASFSRHYVTIREVKNSLARFLENILNGLEPHLALSFIPKSIYSISVFKHHKGLN